MLKVLQNIMILLFKSSTTEDTAVQTINQLNKEVIYLKSRITDSEHSLNESKNFMSPKLVETDSSIIFPLVGHE